MALFVAGALLGLIGILREGEGWWVLSGITFLGAGMILSMVQAVRRRRRVREGEDEEEGEMDGGADDGEGE